MEAFPAALSLASSAAGAGGPSPGAHDGAHAMAGHRVRPRRVYSRPAETSGLAVPVIGACRATMRYVYVFRLASALSTSPSKTASDCSAGTSSRDRSWSTFFFTCAFSAASAGWASRRRAKFLHRPAVPGVNLPAEPAHRPDYRRAAPARHSCVAANPALEVGEQSQRRGPTSLDASPSMPAENVRDAARGFTRPDRRCAVLTGPGA